MFVNHFVPYTNNYYDFVGQTDPDCFFTKFTINHTMKNSKHNSNHCKQQRDHDSVKLRLYKKMVNKWYLKCKKG